MPTYAISEIKPGNGLPFPVTSDEYIAGGYRVVATLADLYAIPDQRRKLGMLAYVQAEGKTYRLEAEGWACLDDRVKSYIDSKIEEIRCHRHAH